MLVAGVLLILARCAYVALAVADYESKYGSMVDDVRMTRMHRALVLELFPYFCRSIIIMTN